jgi:DNA-directed RNA polymerase subunit N (RpoN/RPB10)
MEINTNRVGIRCFTCNVTITHEDVEYDSEVELYRYSGGLESGDMELGQFEDEDGNILDEGLLDTYKIFEACANAIKPSVSLSEYM